MRGKYYTSPIVQVVNEISHPVQMSFLHLLAVVEPLHSIIIPPYSKYN